MQEKEGNIKSMQCEHDLQLMFLEQNKWELYLVAGKMKNVSKYSNLARVQGTEEGLAFSNNSEEKVRFRFPVVFQASRKDASWFNLALNGLIKQGTGFMQVNTVVAPINGVVNIPCTDKTQFRITVELNAHSEIVFTSLNHSWLNEETDLSNNCSCDADVLIVTPDYPTEANLYLCAFAHSRNRLYVEEGLKIQVLAMKPGRNYQTQYVYDDVPVLTGRVRDLKRLILRKQYKTIVVHFADKIHYSIFDGYITNEQIIFICHGPETIFSMLANVCRPYFTQPLKSAEMDTDKVSYIQRYARKDNCQWVFVSEWEMNKSEELLNVRFWHKHVIANTIDANQFAYRKKSASARLKILILRRFDNIRYYSVDIAVRCILALSRRPYFHDLSFDIVGDGWLFDVLTAPVKDFDNVNCIRQFVPNEKIPDLHQQYGILLNPSRYDSQGVTMCEAASSGLVVVGSNVTCVPYFMNEREFHTLAEPEDPEGLADIIEHFYYDPEDYLRVSEGLSKWMQNICGNSNTVVKEVALIKDCCRKSDSLGENLPSVQAVGKPILTVVVPAFNLEYFLPKCLFSILNQRNASKMEVLVISDGSTDGTLRVAEEFQKLSPEIVRVISKENGGHGSVINRGIAEARGTFIRIVDGDDWVLSENLAKEIDLLEDCDCDIVLTQGKHERYNGSTYTDILRYDMLEEGVKYKFNDLTYPFYGFDTYGPVLSTSTYRTTCLKNARFNLSEHAPYVDMEFNAFSLRCVETVVFYDLDIYRYFIGREGQSISRDAWRKNYSKHEYVIFNILDTISQWEDYAPYKTKYVYGHIVAPMVDSQIFMFDQLCKWDLIDPFIERVKRYKTLWPTCLDYIDKHSAASKVILKRYRGEIGASSPIVMRNGKYRPSTQQPLRVKLRKKIKLLVPYGIVKQHQDIKKRQKKTETAEKKAWMFQS